MTKQACPKIPGDLTLAASRKATLGLRVDSATNCNDLNTEQAPGYAVLNATIGKELRFQA